MDALQASQTANVALEAAVRTQAALLKQQSAEIERLRHALRAADSKLAARKPQHKVLEVLPEECKVPETTDAAVQTSQWKQRPVKIVQKKAPLADTSPLVAEAFRLGWLAGAEAKPGCDSEGSSKQGSTSHGSTQSDQSESSCSEPVSAPSAAMSSRASTPPSSCRIPDAESPAPGSPSISFQFPDGDGATATHNCEDIEDILANRSE